MCETDATVGTNSLELPLSVMEITSQSAAAFKFVADQLTDLVFYNCPEAEVIVGDFFRGLGGGVAAQAVADIGLAGNTEEPATADIVIGQDIAESEWHGAAAIPKRLITAGRYSRARRDELSSTIGDWVQAPSIEDVEKGRWRLPEALHDSKLGLSKVGRGDLTHPQPGMNHHPPSL
jgi:hypothetical protein